MTTPRGTGTRGGRGREAAHDYLPDHPNPTRRPEFDPNFGLGGDGFHVFCSMFPDPLPLEMEGKLKPSGWVGVVWRVVNS